MLAFCHVVKLCLRHGKIILSQIDFSTFHGLSLYSMKGCAPTGDDIILIVYHGLSFAYTPWKK